MTPSPLAPSLFLNRELSWLAFNSRVLAEALDERTPLLERLKFLAIFSNNLDEFFMVRVAGLRRQVAAGVSSVPADGLKAQDQLDAIHQMVNTLLARQRSCFEALLPLLAAHGVCILRVEDLSAAEWAEIDGYFEREVFPVLTPLAVDPGHPFPYISNLSLSLAVELRDPVTGSEHFARVKVPKSLPRFVPVQGRPNHFVPLERVIGTNLGALFSGMEILRHHAFRVTRYSDLELSQVEEPEDLLATIEEQVFQRRFGEVVRVEVDDNMPGSLRTLLIDELRDDNLPSTVALSERDIVATGPFLDLSDLLPLASLDLPSLRAAPFVPVITPELRDDTRSIFDVIRERDLLVHHPFESFSASVVRFLQSAATDPQVLAIKITLYRTTGDTAIVQALTEAAQRGKQVAVIVELKARFDEAANITWARTLESFGVHVAYGSAALKTHAKVAMVVRREDDRIRRYVHIGTGNYNSRTARQYTDIGLFTASPSIAADVNDLFNALTGFSRQKLYRKLLVAPLSMRDRFLDLVRRESAHAQEGRPARIIAKMNALVDPEMIGALYEASQAGVQVDLIVRGICCLRPRLAGVSENIRVVSLIGRFLEHSRVWHFANGGKEEFYLGSADWMPRNFDRRVEAVTPIEDQSLHDRMRRVLTLMLEDNRQGWELDAHGTWTQRRPDGPVRATHERLLVEPWGRALEVVEAQTSERERRRKRDRKSKSGKSGKSDK